MSPDENEQKRLKQQAEMDQLMTLLGNNYPPLWWTLYSNLQSEGFNQDQAFRLLSVYILSGTIKYQP